MSILDDARKLWDSIQKPKLASPVREGPPQPVSPNYTLGVKVNSMLPQFKMPIFFPQNNPGNPNPQPTRAPLVSPTSDFISRGRNFMDIPTAGAQQPSPTPQATVMPSPTPSPTASPLGWQSKYQNIYDRVAPQKGISQDQVRVLVTSENGKEIPDYPNYNYDKQGKKISVDTGLLQVNTPLDSPEISKLKDPEYAINKGLGILEQRKNILEDEVLAIASYNLGSGRAVLSPKLALNRAKVIYKNAGVPLPETPFTQDPEGFVNQRMDKYQKLGLWK